MAGQKTRCLLLQRGTDRELRVLHAARYETRDYAATLPIRE